MAANRPLVDYDSDDEGYDSKVVAFRETPPKDLSLTIKK